MGPVDRNSADYDNLIFMSDKYTGIESSKKKEEISVCFDDVGSRMIISGGTGQERLCEIRLADMGGRICYEDRAPFWATECSPVAFLRCRRGPIC